MFRKGQLEQVAQNLVQLGFDCLHSWRIHSLPMQHIVVFDHYLIFTFKGKKEGPETYRPASPTSIPEVVGER